MSTLANGSTTSTTPGPAGQLAIPLPGSLPTVLTRSFVVLSIETDAFVQIFADRIFVAVSQLKGKLGTYLLCETEKNEIDRKQTEYHISTLLGNREDAILGVYARTLTERIQAFQAAEGSTNVAGGATGTPVVVLGISLDKKKGRDPEMFRILIDLLFDMYLDAMRAPLVE